MDGRESLHAGVGMDTDKAGWMIMVMMMKNGGRRAISVVAMDRNGYVARYTHIHMYLSI